MTCLFLYMFSNHTIPCLEVHLESKAKMHTDCPAYWNTRSPHHFLAKSHSIQMTRSTLLAQTDREKKDVQGVCTSIRSCYLRRFSGPLSSILHICVSSSLYQHAYLTPWTAPSCPATSLCICPGYCLSMDSTPSVSLKSPSADEIFKSNSGTALESEGLTWKSLLAGVAYALVLYSVQTLLFIVIRPRFPRV
jgi:hypothetical protein